MIGAVSIILISIGLIIYRRYDADIALQWTLGVVATTSIGVILLALVATTELVLRPRYVEVGEKIVLRYPFGKVVEQEYRGISSLYISSGDPKSIKMRWTGGAVAFSSQRRGNAVTLEIAKAIESNYRRTMGKAPPVFGDR